MKCFTSYARLNADTINGETLVVTSRYTTFDTEEMDKFEEYIRQTIGSGVISEFTAESEVRNEENFYKSTYERFV